MEPIIEIKLDEAKLQNIRRMLRDIPRALPRVISRSINRTVAPVRTYMARQLAGPVNAEVEVIRAAQKKAGQKPPKLKYKISTVKNYLHFQKATYTRWFALIWMIRGKLTREPAFVARMKSGHVSIFRRLGAARLPIADQITRIMRRYFIGFRRQIQAEAQARLERNVEDQVNLALAQWKAGSYKAA